MRRDFAAPQLGTSSSSPMERLMTWRFRFPSGLSSARSEQFSSGSTYENTNWELLGEVSDTASHQVHQSERSRYPARQRSDDRS